MPDFTYAPHLQLGDDTTSYRKLSSDFVSTFEADGKTFLKVDPEALRLLAREAMKDVSFYLRPAHLDKVANILKDPEATDNDRYVAATLLKNAMIAADGELPSCQDTGTAIVMGYKGEQVLTGGDDGEPLSHGVYDTYTDENLRYSQMAPIDMFTEKNTDVIYRPKSISSQNQATSINSYSLPRVVVQQTRVFSTNKPNHYSMKKAS